MFFQSVNFTCFSLCFIFIKGTSVSAELWGKKVVLIFILGLLPEHVNGLQELAFLCTVKIHIHLSYVPNPVIKS